MLMQFGSLFEAVCTKLQQIFVDPRDGRFVGRKRRAEGDGGAIRKMFWPFPEKFSAAK